MMKAAVHQEMSQHRKAHHYHHQVCVGEKYQVVHQLLLGWCVHYYA